MDATTERLFKQMAFANAELLKTIKTLPESALTITQPQSDWSVGQMIAHIIGAARSYLARLEERPRPEPLVPAATHADIDAYAAMIAEADAGFLVQAKNASGAVTFVNVEGATVTVDRATLLAQTIHHATEHRAHIADALAAAGHDVIDLDAMDIWSFVERTGAGS